MPTDATRKLLKVFGIAVTDFEDQTQSTLEQLQDLRATGHDAAAMLDLAEQWLKVSGEALARWLEVTQWLVETQAKAQAELLRGIGAARHPRGK